MRSLKKFKVSNNIHFIDDVVTAKKFKASVLSFMPYNQFDDKTLGFNLAKTNDSTVLLENDIFCDNFLFKGGDS